MSWGWLRIPLQRGWAYSLQPRLLRMSISRHHRLIERSLVEALGYPWDQVHAEAERLSIIFQKSLRTDRCPVGFSRSLSSRRSHPETDREIRDPGGTRYGMAAQRDLFCLRVSDANPELLRYLRDLGLVPGNHGENLLLGSRLGEI